MRRRLIRVAALLLVCGTCLVATASPCYACGCTPMTPKQMFRRAGAAFEGEVTSQRALDAMTTVQTFRVDRVYKGSLHQTVDVVASMGAAGGSDCAILFPEASPVAVVLRQVGGRWTADVCSLMTLDELRRVAPPPQPPLPGDGPTVGGPSAPPSSPGTGGGGGGSGSGGISGAGAIGGGLLAIGVIAFVLSMESRRASRARRDRAVDEDATEEPAAAERQDGGEPDAPDPPEPSG
ncbi:MAG TPA: hypothetical protein VK646_01360 [Actinomycetota bacterium]|nr:hypothetical protein [Actinomycetota bacterium]